jgi:hypothetical protein
MKTNYSIKPVDDDYFYEPSTGFLYLKNKYYYNPIIDSELYFKHYDLLKIYHSEWILNQNT